MSKILETTYKILGFPKTKSLTKFPKLCLHAFTDFQLNSFAGWNDYFWFTPFVSACT